MALKKIIPLFLLFLCLAGCGAKTYTPVIHTAFDLSAVYRTGDFYYCCEIHKDENGVTVLPTSTHAAGMAMTYDGREVTFTKGEMKKSFPADTIDCTNPALLLYEAFSYLENTDDLGAELSDGCFEYRGKTAAGEFVFVQDKNSQYKSLRIPDADIEITFQND